MGWIAVAASVVSVAVVFAAPVWVVRAGLKRWRLAAEARKQPQPDAWDDDARYLPLLHGVDGLPLSVRLSFHFVDRHGQATQRAVDVKRFVSDGRGGAIYGHCHLRDANRPFLMARMSNVVDLETGEIITNLPRWTLEQYEKTPHAAAHAFMDANEAALGLMLAMARSDGAMRKQERELIAKWSVRHGARQDAVPVVLEFLSGTRGPISAQQIGRWLKPLSERPVSYKRELVMVLEAMVDSDKTTRDNEHRLLLRVKKSLLGAHR